MHRLNFLRRVFFNLWYYRKPPWDSGITPPELMDHLNSHPPGRALDLGCGSGTNAIKLSKLGWQVVGVDFALKAIRDAKRKARNESADIHFIVDDVSRMRKVTGEFDLIYDIGCLHNLTNIEKRSYLSRVEELLRENGTYLVYAFLNDDDTSQETGVSNADIAGFSEILTLVDRQDGKDQNSRSSAWFHFRKPGDPS